MSRPPPCSLYLITPPQIADLDAFAGDLAAALDAGGVDAIQIRLKGARDPDTGEETPADEAAWADHAPRLIKIAQSRGVAAIINDRPDLAAAFGADGVHIGQGDADYDEARRLLGPRAQIGVTCHGSRHLAMEAAEAGADYVAFGAFFDSATKPPEHRASLEVLEWWSEIFELPCVAIGGVTPQNCGPLVAAGADFLAVISAVWAHPEGPAQAVRDFQAAIDAALAEGAA